jgi:hypothetical protein
MDPHDHPGLPSDPGPDAARDAAPSPNRTREQPFPSVPDEPKTGGQAAPTDAPGASGE